MVAVMRLPVGPHPHSHGENWMSTPPVFSFAGSSPLTRGEPRLILTRELLPRIIPAHAGKTTGGEWSHGRVRAHPCSRGENIQRQLPVELIQGSSPLTREKLTCELVVGGTAGLIPAHAGKPHP